MAHSRIIQISPKPLSEREYITPEHIKGIGCSSTYRLLPFDEEMKELDKVLGNMFSRKGRVLTFRSCKSFMKEWQAAIKENAASFDIKNWRAIPDMMALFRDTHICSDYLFYISYFAPHTNSFGDLVRILQEYYKPNKKFYIGGILDYHY